MRDIDFLIQQTDATQVHFVCKIDQPLCQRLITVAFIWTGQKN